MRFGAAAAVDAVRAFTASISDQAALTRVFRRLRRVLRPQRRLDLAAGQDAVSVAGARRRTGGLGGSRSAVAAVHGAFRDRQVASH